MSFRIGIVVATHPEDHSVDLVMADDGARLVGVQVATGNGSTRSGSVDLPEVKPAGDKWDVSKTTGQDMKALVAFVGRTPVVAGFLYPQINQMLPKDPRTRIDRHQSDVVSVIDGNGNIDLRHPSGFAIRIGETPEHLDPANMNADANLAVDRNTGRKAYMRISTAGNTAVITVSPDGAVTIRCKDELRIDADGHVTLKTPAGVTADAPETRCTGNLTIDGNVTASGTIMDGSGNSNHHSH